MNPQTVKVKFLVHKDEEAGKDIYAVFPDIEGTKKGNDRLCYSHIGQHSTATLGYIEESQEATMEQAQDLFIELKGIYHDCKLVVQNSWAAEKPQAARISHEKPLVAKLVYVSLICRVVVPEDATDDEILHAAKHKLKASIDNELECNLEDIEDDTECPYDGK